MLKDNKMTADLDCITDLAFQASRERRGAEKYVAMTKAFCDGFEVLVGDISKA